MKAISFTIKITPKQVITFSSETQGLIVNNKEYLALSDGKLIYNKVKEIHSDKVICQLSTNTSTLIPSFRILGISYNNYFDQKEVIASQNNITFYWNPSRLAAFYNRFSTDQAELAKREPIIRCAVNFLMASAKLGADFLPEELLTKIKEPVKLLGFYQGFPIFDNSSGFAKLLSRLGIHIDKNEIMISTPLDEHVKTVEKLAQNLEQKLNIKATYKKNRVVFPTSNKLLNELKITKKISRIFLF